MRRFEDLTYEEYEELTDEELDEYFRPKKINKTKSMLPLFVYLVLKRFSSPDKPLLQKDIIELVSNCFALDVERKAVGRVIHGLADMDIGICTEYKIGTWFEGDRYWK